MRVLAWLLTGAMLVTAGPALALAGDKDEEAKEEAQAKPEAEEGAEAAEAPAEGSSKDGTVVFYRPGRFNGAALNTSVYVDGKEIADLDNGSYLKLKLPAGKHKMHSDDEDDEFEMDVKAGGTHYVRIDIQVGMFKGHGEMLVMDEDQGRSQVEKEKGDGDLDYAEDIRDKTYVVKD